MAHGIPAKRWNLEVVGDQQTPLLAEFGSPPVPLDMQNGLKAHRLCGPTHGFGVGRLRT